jgi:hypothetical protein
MDISSNVVYDDEGKIIYEFKGDEDIEIDEEIEKKINSCMGAKGAICMDGRTKLKRSESIDYGPIKDYAGNIIELTPDEIKIKEEVERYYLHKMPIPKDMGVIRDMDGNIVYDGRLRDAEGKIIPANPEVRDTFGNLIGHRVPHIVADDGEVIKTKFVRNSIFH